MEVDGSFRAVRRSCETFCAAARGGSILLQDASSEADTSGKGPPIQADDAQGEGVPQVSLLALEKRLDFFLSATAVKRQLAKPLK
ncbi:hypothetical protein Pmar_PMAR005465 [Perkinsus marinus ATCC 50983]|uniref:Uncharacterized protein n=1 Tax=Perkinsus marinus (strain ATCC 50983 / TXsc) TaxID=423536 RepID=C5KNC6_PERM5|nr:hypothetical protein Pmar_PMAR005465 [Perkinsus marinus ATCC 50983]EER14020.1 hypothetical protein Pmar_PMAR005465 [Perkinsus marinus ATCC 50983]|eukprot:XP_002782225.1 hypothetical protein Pmar_PMAR005465 [Perkinsus marinus ATCC 50983]